MTRVVLPAVWKRRTLSLYRSESSSRERKIDRETELEGVREKDAVN